MKTKFLSLLFLLVTAISFSQGVVTPFDQIKTRYTINQPTDTQVTTRNATTGTHGYILKSDLIEVLEYTNLAAFPATGVIGKIYIDKTLNKLYRWTGSAYTEVAGGTATTPTLPQVLVAGDRPVILLEDGTTHLLILSDQTKYLVQTEEQDIQLNSGVFPDGAEIYIYNESSGTIHIVGSANIITNASVRKNTLCILKKVVNDDSWVTSFASADLPTPTEIGLGSVANLAPADLPISDDTQDALDNISDNISDSFNKIRWKWPVRAASTGNINIASPPSTLDGVSITYDGTGGLRILLKDQTTISQNGIYQVTAGNVLVRSSDFLTINEAFFAYIYVAQGTVNKGKVFYQTSLGSTDFTFEDCTLPIPTTAGDVNALAIDGSNANTAVNIGAFPFYAGTVIVNGTIAPVKLVNGSYDGNEGGLYSDDAGQKIAVWNQTDNTYKHADGNIFYDATNSFFGIKGGIYTSNYGLFSLDIANKRGYFGDKNVDGNGTLLGFDDLTRTWEATGLQFYWNGNQILTGADIIGKADLSGADFIGDVTGNVIPAGDTSFITKNYLDNQITGITWKNAASFATTGNITLSGSQTVDGIASGNGKRALVKNQTAGENNGIYITSSSGAWVRATDADTAAEVETSTVAITSGTVNKNTQWTCTTTGITLGTTAISYGQISGAGTYTNGTGLDLTANVFSINSSVTTNTGTQTLTNKTINGSNNTISNIAESSVTNLTTDLAGKQATLVSGTNIKSVNSNSLVGSGNISVGDALIANPLSQFASTTSAQVITVVSDETGSGNLVFSTSPSLTTPNIGTPSAATLTNATGLPISTGVSGLGTGVATFLATPSSANLITAVTDETGTGSLVFSASPALTGSPTAPTQTANDGSTKIATTAYSDALVSSTVNASTTRAPSGSSVANFVNLKNYAAKTANYTLSNNQITGDYFIDATANTFTLTLPSAASTQSIGRVFVLKNSGTGVITIATTSSQTIDGVTTKTLNTQYSGYMVMSDGANWKIISAF